MKIGEYYQQGDVRIERVEKIPDGEIVQPDNRGYVLAEGEVSGHCHKIDAVKNMTMIKTADGTLYMRVTKTVPLKHDEHFIHIIEPGEYKVGKILERDHFTRITREVTD